MILNIGERKLKMIQAIMNLKDEFSINKIENELADLNQTEFEHNTIEITTDLLELTQPIKEHISLEEMIEQQQYQPIEREAFFEKAAKIDIQEPIEELLEMLTK